MAEFPLTWVVVADSARARIFEWTSRKAELAELIDLTNSQARQRDSALTSDRPGVASSRGQSRRRMQSTKSEVDNTITEFARLLATELKSGLAKSRYQRLVVVAAPAFLGHLRSQLDAQVSKRLVESVPLNLTKEDTAVIQDHLPNLPSLV